MTEDNRPKICIDLDGVLNLYDGWKGADYFHPPRPGAAEFLRELKRRGYAVIVFTVRWGPHVEEWLEKHNLSAYVDAVTDRKPPAHVYIDDRAVCFRGDFHETLEEVDDFRAFWE